MHTFLSTGLGYIVNTFNLKVDSQQQHSTVSTYAVGNYLLNQLSGVGIKQVLRSISVQSAQLAGVCHFFETVPLLHFMDLFNINVTFFCVNKYKIFSCRMVGRGRVKKDQKRLT